MPRKRFVTPAVVLALAWTSGAVAQANLGFLEYSPEAYFTEEDDRMMYAAADKVLAASEAGTSESWKNPETENNGRITLLKSYRRLDTDCKALKVHNEVPTKNTSATTVVHLCMNPKGEWKILY